MICFVKKLEGSTSAVNKNQFIHSTVVNSKRPAAI